MIKEIVEENRLTTDVIVIGKDIDSILDEFETYSLITYGIEYNASLYRKGMDNRHMIIGGPITTNILNMFNRTNFDTIYIKDIRKSIINFDDFAKTIKPYFHQHTKLYIDITGLNNEYFDNLQEKLSKNGLQSKGKVTHHIKIVLKTA